MECRGISRKIMWHHGISLDITEYCWISCTIMEYHRISSWGIMGCHGILWFSKIAICDPVWPHRWARRGSKRTPMPSIVPSHGCSIYIVFSVCSALPDLFHNFYMQYEASNKPRILRNASNSPCCLQCPPDVTFLNTIKSGRSYIYIYIYIYIF